MSELTLAEAAQNLVDMENTSFSAEDFSEGMSDLRTAVEQLCKYCLREPNGMVIHRAKCNKCGLKILIPCGTDPGAHQKESCTARFPIKATRIPEQR